jgi:uncharacterized protein (TIGR00106 family)
MTKESVLVEIAMFPTDIGESKSEYVSKVIQTIRNSGFSYKVTPMATVVETSNIREALDLIERCYISVEDSNRIYSVIKFDIRKDSFNRLDGKIESIENRIGEVSK